MRLPRLLALLCATLLLPLAFGCEPAGEGPDFNIDYTEYQLDNGLGVIGQSLHS